MLGLGNTADLERDSLAVAFLFLGQSLFMKSSSHSIMYLFDLNFANRGARESRWIGLAQELSTGRFARSRCPSNPFRINTYVSVRKCCN